MSNNKIFRSVLCKIHLEIRQTRPDRKLPCTKKQKPTGGRGFFSFGPIHDYSNQTANCNLCTSQICLTFLFPCHSYSSCQFAGKPIVFKDVRDCRTGRHDLSFEIAVRARCSALARIVERCGGICYLILPTLSAFRIPPPGLRDRMPVLLFPTSLSRVSDLCTSCR